MAKGKRGRKEIVDRPQINTFTHKAGPYFVGNSVLKTCTKVEQRTQGPYVITGVPFPGLKNIYKSIFMGKKQNSCTNNYSTWIQPEVVAYIPGNTYVLTHIRRPYKAVVNETRTSHDM
jgi:hypothetical protein